jgi:hypothetical protein
MKTLNTIQTPLFHLKQGILCHLQFTGVMGISVMSAFHNAYPDGYRYHLRQSVALGQLNLITVHSQLSLANLQAVSNGQIHYQSLIRCLKTLQAIASEHEQIPYLPYGIGSGCLGGSWTIIRHIIGQYCPSAVICRIPHSLYYGHS